MPANAIMSPKISKVGPTVKAPPVAAGVLTLLVAVVPVPELVTLEVGTVSGAVPILLKLVVAECGILTGPGPDLIVVNRFVGDGTTEVIVSVCGGLKNVSVITVVTPSVGTENVLPDFAPVNVPVVVPGSPDEGSGTVVVSCACALNAIKPTIKIIPNQALNTSIFMLGGLNKRTILAKYDD